MDDKADDYKIVAKIIGKFKFWWSNDWPRRCNARVFHSFSTEIGLVSWERQKENKQMKKRVQMIELHMDRFH